MTGALPYEATQTDARALGDEASTQPQLDAPDELAAEATQPAAPLPTPEPAAPAPRPPAEQPSVEVASEARPTPPPDDFVSVPTVVVDPSAVGAEPAPTYSMDMRSGHVSLAHEETSQVALPAELPDELPKSRVGLFVGLGALALLVVGVGGAAAYLLLAPPDESAPIAHVGAEDTPEGDDSEGDEGAAPVADPDAVSTEEATAETEATPTTDQGADEEGTDDADLADEAEAGEGAADADEDEGESETAPAPTGDLTREAMLAFELESLRPSRRASRMTQARRRAQADRLKSRALRAYRGEAHDEAERLYREALTYNSWDVAAIEGLARATAQQGRFPEARAWAQLAVDRNPRSAATYRILGDVWRQAGFDDEARDAYRRGLRRVPDDRWLRQRIRDLR
ncbi:MAG: tetratricopeptide repeat protein [Sandaracinaceae bacterium]